MNHNKIRSKLSAYKDNELNEGMNGEVLQHLQTCDACREELKELDRIDHLVRSLPEIDVSEAFASEVTSRVLKDDCLSGMHAARSFRRLKLSFLQRIVEGVSILLDSIFEVLPGFTPQGAGALDELGDFPPLLLSHAYFRLIGQ